MTTHQINFAKGRFMGFKEHWLQFEMNDEKWKIGFRITNLALFFE